MFETDYANSTPSHLAFAGNPIILRDDFELAGQTLNGYPFTVKMDGAIIFSGRFNYPYVINIADIIRANVNYVAEPQPSRAVNGCPLYQIEDPEEFARRHVRVRLDGEYDYEMDFYALPGGISRQNLKVLSATPDEDIFTRRFFAVDGNFFLTTRTAAWSIVMKETELCPLYYINDFQDDELKIVERTGGHSLTVDCIDPGIYALDIDGVRRHFFDEHGVLANRFDIYRRDNFACRIVIAGAELARQRCRIKFRNSLGVFEIIELTGEVTYDPELSGEEDETYNTYDPITDDYVAARDRIAPRQKITVATGTKRADEIRFLMDMLASDEVYLLDVAPLPVKVIPSAEEFSYGRRPTGPLSFNISLQVAEDETYLLPDIIDGNDSRKPRVFAKQFSKQFK